MCECVCVEMSTVCSVVDEIEMKKKEQTKEKRENRKENEKRTKKKIEFCVAFKERAGKNPCRGARTVQNRRNFKIITIFF